jgi:ABC-type spermidine/putrescine transport system permease subunit II
VAQGGSVFSPFWLALGRSVLVGIIVAAVSFGIGWPLGVRVGLTTFPIRRLLLALPLFLPLNAA